MKTLGIFWIVSFLMGSALGRLLLLGAVLWWLDYRYFGLLAALWAPIARWQRISSLKSSVQQNPSDVRSMVELGEHYLRGGDYQTSAHYLEKAFDRGEDGPRALFALGGAWVKLGRHAEGRAKLESAVKQAPNTAYGEPYVYLLEEAFATDGANSARVEELVGELKQFEGVEIPTRAGRVCAAAGRKDLAKRLFQEAIANYSYIPKKMRRRERRWLIRARVGLMQAG